MEFPWKPCGHLINNMAVSYTGEALQGILRASATLHTQSLDLSKKDIEVLPEDFPVLQNLLVSCFQALHCYIKKMPRKCTHRVCILRETGWLCSLRSWCRD